MKKALILLLITVMLANSGCYTIRKKFIRQKKYQKEEPVYIDFKEYPQRPSREAYLDYYLFSRGWIEELVGALEKGLSAKRQKRAISETIMNLEQIITFYNKEGQTAIYPLYEDFLAVKSEIDASPNMGQLKREALIRKVESLKRKLEKDFNYTEAQKWFADIPSSSETK